MDNKSMTTEFETEELFAGEIGISEPSRRSSVFVGVILVLVAASAALFIWHFFFRDSGEAAVLKDRPAIPMATAGESALEVRLGSYVFGGKKSDGLSCERLFGGAELTAVLPGDLFSFDFEEATPDSYAVYYVIRDGNSDLTGMAQSVSMDAVRLEGGILSFNLPEDSAIFGRIFFTMSCGFGDDKADYCFAVKIDGSEPDVDPAVLLQEGAYRLSLTRNADLFSLDEAASYFADLKASAAMASLSPELGASEIEVTSLANGENFFDLASYPVYMYTLTYRIKCSDPGDLSASRDLIYSGGWLSGFADCLLITEIEGQYALFFAGNHSDFLVYSDELSVMRELSLHPQLHLASYAYDRGILFSLIDSIKSDAAAKGMFADIDTSISSLSDFSFEPDGSFTFTAELLCDRASIPSGTVSGYVNSNGRLILTYESLLTAAAFPPADVVDGFVPAAVMIDGERKGVSDQFLYVSDDASYVNAGELASLLGLDYEMGSGSFSGANGFEVRYRNEYLTVYTAGTGYSLTAPANTEWYPTRGEMTHPPQIINGEFYIPSSGITAGFFASAEVDSKAGTVKVLSLDALRDAATEFLTDLGLEADFSGRAEYDRIIFSGYYPAKNGLDNYLVNLAGKVALGPFSGRASLSGGRFTVTTADGSRSGLYSLDGQCILEVKYSRFHFVDGNDELLLVCEGDRWGLFHVTGNSSAEIIPTAFDDVGWNSIYLNYSMLDLHDDFLLFGRYIAVRRGEKWGVYDLDGNLRIPIEYDSVGAYYTLPKIAEQSDSPASFLYYAEGEMEAIVVGKGGKWGTVDMNGNVIVPIEYDYVFSDEEGNWFGVSSNMMTPLRQSSGPADTFSTEAGEAPGQSEESQSHNDEAENAGMSPDKVTPETESELEVGWEGESEDD